MKKYRKSNWLTILLLVYVTAMAVYLVPRNTETGDMEKYITVAVAYVIVLLLWFVLRKKEKLAEERKKDLENKKKESQNK